MSRSFDKLASAYPTDTNEADLYTVPTGKDLVGAVDVCNQDSTARTFSLAVTDTGAGVAANSDDWIRYNFEIPANLAFSVPIYGLAAGKTIRIQNGTASTISYVLMGGLRTL